MPNVSYESSNLWVLSANNVIKFRIFLDLVPGKIASWWKNGHRTRSGHGSSATGVYTSANGTSAAKRLWILESTENQREPSVEPSFTTNLEYSTRYYLTPVTSTWIFVFTLEYSVTKCLKLVFLNEIFFGPSWIFLNNKKLKENIGLFDCQACFFCGQLGHTFFYLVIIYWMFNLAPHSSYRRCVGACSLK